MLKDTNFTQITKAIGNKLINLNKDESKALASVLEADSKFLASHGLMDYSLLLVVETCPIDGRQSYHMGIIDYLQTWNCSKKMEHCFKTTIKRGIKDKLSAVPPPLY